MPDQITMNSLVLLHYSLAFTEGTIIESSFDDEPIQIEMGQHDLTEGMELAIFGLEEGVEQTITLTPEQTFGFRDEDNIHDMPMTDFPDDLQPTTGLAFSFETPDGEEIPGTVVKVDGDNVEVDFNHPLAGHDLVFRVEILGINNSHAHIHADEP